jgi:TolB protein
MRASAKQENKPMRNRIYVGLITMVAAMLLSGCGGGSNPGGSSGGNTPLQTMNFGPMITRVAGTLQPPVIISGNGLVVTGAAGATISSLVLSYPKPLLSQSRITFGSTRGDGGVYAMDSDGSNVIKLPLTNFDGYSPDGTKVVYSRYNSGTGQKNIFTSNADGTGELQLTNNAVHDDVSPAWSPDGTTIAYASNGSLFTILANGSGTPVNISQAGSFDRWPAWSPDGTRIAYIAQPGDGTGQLRTKSPTPGGSGLILHSGFVDSYPAWSPDGYQIAFATNADGAGTSHIYVSDGLVLNKQLTNTASQDKQPAWSPDGSAIVIERVAPGGISNQTTLVSAVDGSTIANLTNNSIFNEGGPQWQPFQKTRTLVGTGAPLGTASAGFLFGQQADIVTSVLSFNATTPANARVVAQSNTAPNQPNLIFVITTTDSLTGLAYENNINLPAVQLTQTGSPNTAVVSFDAFTGQVASVLPYAANRASGTGSQPTRNGNTLIYHAHFLGVWNKEGKNLAPHGASEVHLDARTGRILSFQ